ncbi:MAG TPA: hypothetical protein VFC51_06795 [Chloroflexota bacterium]|nr:hypothetical protein [Chloroflexota bacterium]
MKTRAAFGTLALAAVVAGVLLRDGEPARGGTAQQPVDYGTPTLLNVAFGPAQIWSPGEEVRADLFRCQQRLACVAGVMMADGASPDAIAFFHLTGWFLTDIQDFDPVQLGTIFVPWRANENTQMAFLGGMPAVIYPEQAGSALRPERDADYQAILAEHPDVLFWAPGPSFEGVEPTDDGGQRFLLKYRLLDGCHACAILGWAHAAFKFGPDGTYEGVRLLSVEAT